MTKAWYVLYVTVTVPLPFGTTWRLPISSPCGLQFADPDDPMDPMYKVMVTGLNDKSEPSPPGGQIHVHMASPSPTLRGAAPSVQGGQSQAAQPDEA